MEIMYVPGKGPGRLFYGAVVQTMTVGIGGSGIETFPLIDLIYSDETRDTVVKILEQMDQNRNDPTVHIWRNEVAIIFRCTPTPFRFLKEHVLPSGVSSVVREGARATSELIMTAEAELPTGAVDPFIQLYARMCWYRLSVVRPKDDNRFARLWSRDMRRYVPSPPSEL